MGRDTGQEVVERNRVRGTMNLGSQTHQSSSRKPYRAKINFKMTFVNRKSSSHEGFKYICSI